jgi:hypothetical protein
MGCGVVLLGRWPQTTENSPLPRCTPQPLADSLPMSKTLLAVDGDGVSVGMT